MKLFVKLMLALCVVAVAAPFLLKGPDGTPLLRVRDLVLPGAGLPDIDLPILRAAGESPVATATGARPAGDGVRMYRWRDAAGTVHFAGEAPEGVQAEVIVVQDNITRLAADWVPEAPPAAAPAVQTANPLQVYGNPEQAIEQARDAARLLEQHNRRLDALAAGM